MTLREVFSYQNIFILSLSLIYTLIETGLRRAAVRNLNLEDINFKKRSISADEKGAENIHTKLPARVWLPSRIILKRKAGRSLK